MSILVDGERGPSSNFVYSFSDEEFGSCLVHLTFMWSGNHVVNFYVFDQESHPCEFSIAITPDPTEKDRYVRSVLEGQVALKIQQWSSGI